MYQDKYNTKCIIYNISIKSNNFPNVRYCYASLFYSEEHTKVKKPKVTSFLRDCVKSII